MCVNGHCCAILLNLITQSFKRRMNVRPTSLRCTCMSLQTSAGDIMKKFAFCRNRMKLFGERVYCSLIFVHEFWRGAFFCWGLRPCRGCSGASLVLVRLYV